MNTTTLTAVVVWSAVLLCGCAVGARPLQIGVTDNGFSVGERAFKTPAGLTEAIRESGATECRLTPRATVGYGQVEAAMRAVKVEALRPCSAAEIQ